MSQRGFAAGSQLRLRPEVYVATGGNDAGSCTRAAPCGTFDRAYHRAKPGQLVLVASGDYVNQSLTFDPTKVDAPANVRFQPAPGAKVTVSDELSIRASASKPVAHVEFDGLSIGDYYVAYAHDLVFRNVATSYFFLRAVNHVRIVRGRVGPNGGDSVSPTLGGYSADTPSTNVVIDGVSFTGLTRKHQGEHIECLFIQESDGVVIRNSRFSTCDVISIYVNPIVGGQVSNLLVEGNFIGSPTDHALPAPFRCAGCVAFQVGSNLVRNVTVRLNRSDGGSFAMDDGPHSGIVFTKNVGLRRVG